MRIEYKSFTDRVNYAARCIKERWNVSDEFYACFEMGDGDLVVVSLYRRYYKRPDLYPHIFDYLDQENVYAISKEYTYDTTPSLPGIAEYRVKRKERNQNTECRIVVKFSAHLSKDK